MLDTGRVAPGRERSQQAGEQRKHKPHACAHGQHLPQCQAAASCCRLQRLPRHTPVDCKPAFRPWPRLSNLQQAGRGTPAGVSEHDRDTITSPSGTGAISCSCCAQLTAVVSFVLGFQKYGRLQQQGGRCLGDGRCSHSGC